MVVTIEIDTWQELFRNSWAGALDTLREIEAQGREEEALERLEDLFNPDVWEKIPSETDVNNYIWFDLADDMNLYDEDEEEEDEEDEED